MRAKLTQLLFVLVYGAAVQAAGFSGRGSQDQRCFSKKPGQINEPRLLTSFETGSDVRTEPLILPDGTVVVGSVDKWIYWLNPDGSLKAKYFTGAGNVSSGAWLAATQTVVMGSGNGKVYFFDSSGNLKKFFKTGGSVFSSPGISADGRSLVVGSSDGNIYFLNPDATVRSTFFAGAPLFTGAVFLSHGEAVVAAQNGKVFFFRTDDSLKAVFQAGASPTTAAVRSDDSVIIGSADGILYFLSPDGVELYRSSKPVPMGITRPAVGEDGTIVFGSADNSLNFLTAQGQPLATYSTSGRYPGNPIFLSSKIIATGANDDTVHFVETNGNRLQMLGPLGPLENGQAFMPAPTLANDGTLIVGSADGFIYFLNTGTHSTPCLGAGTLRSK